MPVASRSELITEATAVWQRAGVDLDWISGADGSLAPARMLRVLVIPRRSGTPEVGPAAETWVWNGDGVN